MTCVFCKRPMDGEPIIEGGCRDCADKHYADDGGAELRRQLEVAKNEAAGWRIRSDQHQANWQSACRRADAAEKEAERQKQHNALLDSSLRQERERRKQVQRAAEALEHRATVAEARAAKLQRRLDEIESAGLDFINVRIPSAPASPATATKHTDDCRDENLNRDDMGLDLVCMCKPFTADRDSLDSHNGEKK